MQFLKRPLHTIDIFKTIAIFFMIIDHIGAFFFYDQLWWRVIGRTFGPVWYFLIGYASSRSVTLYLISAACILMIADIILGMRIFPLNGLFTIIIIRLLIDYIAGFALRSYEHLFLFTIIALVLIVPVGYFLDNDVVSLVIALAGYVRRRLDDRDLKGIVARPRIGLIVAGLTLVLMAYSQYMVFNFNLAQMITLVGGFAMTMFVVMRAPMTTWSKPKLPRVVLGLAQFCGRYTLEIFVGHLLLFKIIQFCLYRGDNGLKLLQWQWF